MNQVTSKENLESIIYSMKEKNIPEIKVIKLKSTCKKGYRKTMW